MATTRKALITGGASGLGAASAERLRSAGLEVYTLDVSVGADLTVDVSDGSAVRDAVAEVGDIDVVVNAAAILGPSGPVIDTSLSDWTRVFAINLMGTINTMQAAVPGMRDRGWGRVVNFASIAGLEGNVNQALYSASKAGVVALTKVAGKELATTGVLVNAIAPGLIATPMSSALSDEDLERSMGLVPMHRTGRPEEVAELVTFLATDQVSFSTGAVYDISGGRAVY